MPMVRAVRMWNDLLADQLDGAALQTLLADGGRLAEFNVMLGLQGAPRDLAASAPAMYAVIASATARAALVASATAMSAVANNQIAKMIVWNDDTALNAMFASTVAIAALRAAAAYAIVTTASAVGTTGREIPVPVAGGVYLAAGVSTSDNSTSRTITLTTRRAASARAATHTTNSTSVSSTAAGGAILVPLIAPYSIVSNDSTDQTFSVGLLRCDI